jgi:hypothetical protein
MAGSKRLAVIREAIDVVLRRLSALSPSPAVEDLRVRASEYLLQTQGWATTAPTVAERESLTKSVLTLHVEVTKLERTRA